MARTVGIGLQNFEKIMENNLFYIDKTMFIKEWWESNDEVTLITRPRRFGKTLTMSMLEKFFSVDYAEKNLFKETKIGKLKNFQELQGKYPVIYLSFSNVKERTFDQAKKMICEAIVDLYNKYSFLCTSNLLNEKEKELSYY